MITSANMWILESYHFVKDMGPCGEKLIEIKHVPTKFNLADIFTKGVSPETFDKLVSIISGNKSVLKLLKDIEDVGGQSRHESTVDPE